ncbi:DUF1120 domain-containing protein [Pseudomonas orientalis]|uniref:DUF1120 domain-containing protein n=1 Tax=Pseudomonas orientalis TaxID=76758 RepID=A0A2L0RS22_9PSED|nr:DUF1120 domain-containing protein [Pseudomonas orientalis]AUZ44937.1 hypothetical protein BOP93_04855 [Pseudomonas orientalis]
MKTPVRLMSGALLLVMSSSALAASSVDLTVKGLITPSACAPGLSSGGVIDHGKVAAKDLKPDNWTLLGNHTLQLAITCDAPTLLALKGVDNQGNAHDPMNSYGLGLVSGKKLGGYTLTLENPMADGAAITLLESSDNGLTWRDVVPGDIWPVSYLTSFGVRSTGSWAPTPVQQVTADLDVQTMIAPTAGMDLTTEVAINGSATIEVKYL